MDKFIIVGNGVAGVTAAENIAKTVKADVTILSSESVPFYNRIQLNDFLSGYLTVSDLIVRDVDWYKERDIHLYLQTEVKSIDIQNHIVMSSNGDLYEFDRLLLATGGICQ